MPVFSTPVHLGTENVIDPETITVHREGHVLFFNEGDCTVTVDVPNDLFGDIHDIVIPPRSDSGPIEVSPQAPIGDNKFKVAWNCPGNDSDGFGDGPKTGHIKVED